MCNQACCSIVPHSVLVKLSKDKTLSKDERSGFSQTAKYDLELRKIRTQAGKLTRLAMLAPAAKRLAPSTPAIEMYNCNHSQTLPGSIIPSPGSSADAVAKRAFATTTKMAEFYKTLFGRNSIDNLGMTIVSSIHFGTDYNNAFWNGFQMAYGDGDGKIFVDFTKSNDVVGHELSHGVTQHSLQLNYANEPGGLNESISDVFGTMFRQWLGRQSVTAADWLIGKDIMGPTAIAKGYNCLRNMKDPAANGALAAQPKHYSKYRPGMDPHESSGIPNFAFYNAATMIGGNSWDKAGQIWYHAMTSGRPAPSLKMKAFADRTRKSTATLFPGDVNVGSAIDKAWKIVGL
jgi:Zn-dependent metalloprotease